MVDFGLTLFGKKYIKTTAKRSPEKHSAHLWNSDLPFAKYHHTELSHQFQFSHYFPLHFPPIILVSRQFYPDNNVMCTKCSVANPCPFHHSQDTIQSNTAEDIEKMDIEYRQSLTLNPPNSPCSGAATSAPPVVEGGTINTPLD